MKFSAQNLLLYAVTDRAWVGRQTLLEQIESALKGGVTLVQLREKSLPEEQLLQEAKEAAALCHRYGVPPYRQRLGGGGPAKRRRRRPCGHRGPACGGHPPPGWERLPHRRHG